MWQFGGGEPVQEPASPGPALLSPLPSAHPGRPFGDPSSLGQAAGCRLEPTGLGLGLCLVPPSLPLTWWFVLHLVCGAAGPALRV